MENSTHNDDRVKQASPSQMNQKIERETWKRVAEYSNRSAEELSARIKQLDKEWDIERYLGVNMSTIALLGLALAYFVHNNWLILPAIVLGFFLQHSVQGWCPPLPILRSLKIRTCKEIQQEKYALKLLRGDFQNLLSISQPQLEDLKYAIEKS